MRAEKIYVSAKMLRCGRRTELTQMSQVVFAALVNVHCLLEAPHLLVPVANRCHFVGSSHRREKTAVLEDQSVSVLRSAFSSCFCLM